MNQIILKNSLPLFVFIFGFCFFPEIKAQRNDLNSVKSCSNYRYKDGINFNIKSNNSFELLSTANIELLDNFVSFALDEAEFTAKTNLSEFLKLNDPSSEDYLIEELKIRKNGRLIRKKSQIKNDLKFLKSIFSNGYRGIRLIDSCFKSGKYVKVTIKVTDKTYKMAEFLEKKMK